MSGRSLVELIVAPDDAEVAADLLWMCGATAVEERPGEPPRRVTLVADADPAAVERSAAGRWPMATVVVDERAGLDGWRPFARAVRAGRRVVVRPPWVPYDAVDGDLVLDIDPGYSFGSGSHASTRLVLAMLDREVGRLAGVSVLDIGCGSGVLSVAAARLGAARVVALDVDPLARESARANAGRNGVSDRIEVTDASVSEITERFDVVVANLSRALCISLAGDISRVLLRPEGVAVLAGFFPVDAAEVAGAYPGMRVIDEEAEDGWGVVVLTSRRAAPRPEPSHP